MGLGNVLVVLSADHGVAPLPSNSEEKKMPGGYISGNLEDVITSALDKRFGNADWLIPEPVKPACTSITRRSKTLIKRRQANRRNRFWTRPRRHFLTHRLYTLREFIRGINWRMASRVT